MNIHSSNTQLRTFYFLWISFFTPCCFFVPFHTKRVLWVISPLPKQARDNREVDLPAVSSLRAKGSHQLPLSSPKAGKRSLNTSRKQRAPTA